MPPYANVDRFLANCGVRGAVPDVLRDVVRRLQEQNPDKRAIQEAVDRLPSQAKKQFDLGLSFLKRDYLSTRAPAQAVSRPASPPDRVAAELARIVAARENRVVVRKHQRLVFTMTGGTDLDVDMPLRFNMRKTGVGVQDAEILVTLPIFVHQGAASKQHWISLGYDGDLFDRTTHGSHLGVTGATANDAVLKTWTKTINDWWGNAAVIHHPAGGTERYYRLKFEFSFTDDGSKACKEVCCVQTSGAALTTNPNGTIDAVRWGANDSGPGGPICHEVGHFLGCPDEYYTITYDGRTRAWGDGWQANAGVMNNPGTKPFARHYRIMGQELANQFGFNADDASVVLDVTLLLNNPSQRRHKLSGHIWDA